MIRGERGQALVEAVGALPVLLLCSLTIVECGVVVRDRVATSQAAGRAGRAVIEGSDAAEAARAALPKSLRSGARITDDVEHGRVTVRTRTHLGGLHLAPVTHVSTVRVTTEDER